MATIVDVTGATYPKEYNGNTILPCEGESLVPSFARDGFAGGCRR
jgi:hypothetical protein